MFANKKEKFNEQFKKLTWLWYLSDQQHKML